MLKRSEMKPEYTWDFSHIYPTREDWEKAYQLADELIEQIPPVAGTLGQSADSLLNACEKYMKAMEVIEKVYIYANLHKSTDNGDSDYQAMEARCISLLMRLSSNTAFFIPELLSIDEAKLNEYLADPRMEIYRQMITDACRGRAHTLDAEREKMLAMLAEVENTPGDAFGMLSDVEMEFPDIIDEEGNHLPLTSGNFNTYRESPVRSIREQAFNNFLGMYKKHINTCASLYGGSVKMNAYQAAVRNYGSVVEQKLFANNVPVSVYDSLLDAIHASLPMMRKYIELRKKALKLEKIDMCDLYVPMIPDVDFSMPYEEGKKLVREAVKPLGEEYQKLIDRAYSERWMDVYENPGKTSGAFSCGLFGVHPYVLLNYTDTLDDAFTLGHELGHAMHSWFSDSTQPYPNHDYSIMVAEVASTVNEVLMAMHLLKTETDKKRRAYVLNFLLESFRTTVFRQTLFAEFERKAHDMYAEGTPLTAQNLSAMFKGLCEMYYEGCEVPEILENEWAYIPHFYGAYYVYQYATGFCSAVAIAEDILSTGDPSRYLKFLSTGGSDYPLEELKIAGVDLTRPDTVRRSLKAFDAAIDELAALLTTI